MNAMVQDVKKAVRSLRRSRGFVIVTVLSLGLALGVTTTMFGIVDAVLHPVVPLSEPDKLVIVANAGDGAGHDVTWRETLEAPSNARGLFAQVSLESARYSYLRIGQHYYRQTVRAVSPEFFSLTGISPFLGRDLRDDSSGNGTEDVAMVSFRIWRSALAGRKTLDDASVEVNGRIYRVVGVIPSNLPWSLQAGVYIPFSSVSPADQWFPSLVARLAPGVEASEAQRVLRATVDPVLRATHGVGRRPFSYRVAPVIDGTRVEMSNLQRVLIASALIVLIIACGNFGNLMLARGLSRERDFALSFALGARRANIIRQSVAEALLCASGGALVGIVIAGWAFHMVTYKMQREVPALGVGVSAVSLNWRVFAFVACAAVGTALVAALWPAIRTSSVDLNVPLKSAAGTTTGRSRSRFSALAVGELALTMTLLLGAGLLMKAVSAMTRTELGYEPRGLLTVSPYIPMQTSLVRRLVPQSDVRNLRDYVRPQPGVIDAALEGTGLTPRLGQGLTSALAGGGNRRLFAQTYPVVSPEYLATLGIPIVEGRDFTQGDATGSGAAIVNEAAARELWMTDTPVGQMLKLGDLHTDAQWLPVVGVAKDTRPLSTVMPATEAVPEVWIVPSRADSTRLDRLVVRVDPSHEVRLRTDLHRMGKEILPPGTVMEVESALEDFDEERTAREFVGRLFVAFGGIAMALAAVGLYSLLSFTVTERRRELAVRCALGATGAQCARNVLHDAAIMVLAGTGIGAFVAMWLARQLDEMLYSVFYTDAAALVLAEVVIIGVALGACLVPALRAARSDPAEVLRAT